MENNETIYRSPGVLNAELHKLFEQQGPLYRKIGEQRRAAEEQYKLSEMENNKDGLDKLTAVFKTLDNAESFHSERAELITDAAKLIRNSGAVDPASVQHQLQDEFLPKITKATSKIDKRLRAVAGIIQEVGAAETPLSEPKPAPKSKASKPAPAAASVEPKESAQSEPESIPDPGEDTEPECDEATDTSHPKTASQPTNETSEESENPDVVTPEWLTEQLSLLSQEEQNEVIAKANELRSNAEPEVDEPHVEIVEPVKKRRIQEESVRYAPAKKAGVKKNGKPGLLARMQENARKAAIQPEPTDHHAQP